MATEMIKGKSVDEALAITNKAVLEALQGLPPAKIHCSLLAEEAIHAAIMDYRLKTGGSVDNIRKCDGCCNACDIEHDHVV
jgi:nitrogen fixation NifU-like protein